MLRGIYTGANGMNIQQVRMDVIANNLANADKTAFKRDTTVFKAFPELLLHRMGEDGVGRTPMGSFDTAPLVGKIGLGGEVNEVYTRFEQGAVKKTDNAFDLMLQDKPGLDRPAFFSVMTNRGERLSRSGSFILDRQGYLVTPQGFPLMGEKGPIQINHGNFLVKENGEVYVNGRLGTKPEDGINFDQNRFEEPMLLDKIKIRTVENPRHLDKEGDSFYNDTPESGEPRAFRLGDEPQILQGYLEASNVSVVTEMVEMIEVNRAYEANSKALQTHDQLLGRLINEVSR